MKTLRLFVPGRWRGLVTGLFSGLVPGLALGLTLLLTLADAAAPPRDARVRRAAIPDGITLTCPDRPSNKVGPSFAGQNLGDNNFAYQDLTNADFSGATIRGVVFVGANLTGANFTGAKFQDIGGAPSNPYQSNDFSYANLTSACFINAQFTATGAVTTFAHADLTCADFSGADVSTRSMMFGTATLKMTPPASATDCRPRFRYATINCEFVPQWKYMDLTGVTNLADCAAKLKGADLSGGVFVQAVFDGVNLSATHFAGANLQGAWFQRATLDGATGLSGTTSVPALLTGAHFNSASVRGVDFSAAQLYGADFTNANLDGSSFAGAKMGLDGSQGAYAAATFSGAWLRNVNLASAKLQAVNFENASVFGTYASTAPKALCTVGTTPCKGLATCGCASMASAELSSAKFNNAFLYGVDFSGANALGTQFSSAVLVSANLSGVTFGPDTTGAAVAFKGAWLQGATFVPTAKLDGVSMDDAFFDFGADANTTTGNQIVLLLPSTYTAFAGWAGGATPCVKVRYASFSTVPTNVSTMTCPDGFVHPAGGCGPTPPAPATTPSSAPNPNWKSGTRVPANPGLPGFYVNVATYDDKVASPEAQCAGGAVDPSWNLRGTPPLAVNAPGAVSTSTHRSTR